MQSHFGDDEDIPEAPSAVTVMHSAMWKVLYLRFHGLHADSALASQDNPGGPFQFLNGARNSIQILAPTCKGSSFISFSFYSNRPNLTTAGPDSRAARTYLLPGRHPSDRCSAPVVGPLSHISLTSPFPYSQTFIYRIV